MLPWHGRLDELAASHGMHIMLSLALRKLYFGIRIGIVIEISIGIGIGIGIDIGISIILMTMEAGYEQEASDAMTGTILLAITFAVASIVGIGMALSPSFNVGLEFAQNSQHVVVQRKVNNPFEESEVIGITNYIDFGFELLTREKWGLLVQLSLFLLSHGGSLHSVSVCQPLADALHYKNHDMVMLLEKHGAKPLISFLLLVSRYINVECLLCWLLNSVSMYAVAID
nr:hypothetical protein [Tanacetum cinerariifolium]